MILLATLLISLHMPACPEWIQGIALGRQWIKEDTLELEKMRSLNERERFDLYKDRMHFERELLKRYLRAKKG